MNKNYIHSQILIACDWFQAIAGLQQDAIISDMNMHVFVCWAFCKLFHLAEH